MPNLDDLIQYENESAGLDFKATQYVKAQYPSLLKDVMSMANADISGERLIIIGVKHFPDGRREVLGIPKDEFVDAATYQQVIHENIEPPIHIDYSSYPYDGKLLGIFHISECRDQPYLMKKDFNGLHKGDCFIRKGSHQLPMDRRDLDRIYQKKLLEAGFQGKVLIGFDSAQKQHIQLPVLSGYKSPSKYASEEIQQILAQRKTKPLPPFRLAIGDALRYAGQFSRVSYSSLTNDELEEALQKVEETYREEDNYDFFELHAHHLNLTILNEGTEYIEDASISLTFTASHGEVAIAPKIFSKPQNGMVYIPTVRTKPYPSVEHQDDHFQIRQHIGDIRHGIPIHAFQQPIRLVLNESIKGKFLTLHCALHGKNLRTPIKAELRIEAVGNRK